MRTQPHWISCLLLVVETSASNDIPSPWFRVGAHQWTITLINDRKRKLINFNFNKHKWLKNTINWIISQKQNTANLFCNYRDKHTQKQTTKIPRKKSKCFIFVYHFLKISVCSCFNKYYFYFITKLKLIRLPICLPCHFINIKVWKRAIMISWNSKQIIIKRNVNLLQGNRELWLRHKFTKWCNLAI